MSNYNVLFLCNGVSTRSVMAEAIMNWRGRPDFKAFSAGSRPTGSVRPDALLLIDGAGLSTDGPRKFWEELARPGSPHISIAFTVCDNAAFEVCLVWPGQPITASWGAPDPAACHGGPAKMDRVHRQASQAASTTICLLARSPILTSATLHR